MDDILGKLERLGADFARVRHERTKSLAISLTENEIFQVIESDGEGGHAIDVIIDGGHSHFGTAHDLTLADLKFAVLINSKRGKEQIPEAKPVKDNITIKPSEGLQKSVEEKVGDVRNLRKAINKCGIGLKELIIDYEEEIFHKEYTDSLGNSITQDFPRSSIGIKAVAKRMGVFATAEEHDATIKGYIFDLIDSDGLRRSIRRKLDAQLNGSLLKAGNYEAILAPEVVGTLSHEVLGHLAESDMADFGILSMLKGKKIADSSISILDRPTLPNGHGGCFVPYDDEGMRGRTVKILERGVVNDFMTNWHYANILGEVPTGNARAENYYVQPTIRMRNTNMAAGALSVEELIESVKNGILVCSAPCGNGSPEGNFQFELMEAYKIKNGEKVEGLRAGVPIAGHVLQTLARINGISKETGISSEVCTKLEQDVYVSVGGPYARVSKLKVGGHA
jgi:TldD protein